MSARTKLFALSVLTSLAAAAGSGGQEKPPRAAPAKARPAGIFYLLEPHSRDHRIRQLDNRQGWKNPNVAGVTLRIHWSVLEPREGKFDWSFFDAGVKVARQRHKRLGLSVQAGIQTPDWVYKAGAPKFKFLLRTNYSRDAEATMPLPWDRVFLDKWGRFVRALGKRYDGAPEVAYVMIAGPGSAVETYFVRTRDDLGRVKKLGGTARWLAGSKKVIDLYAKAFPRTPFILAMAPPVPGQEGEAALKQLVGYGVKTYPGRFGVMHHGLNAQSSARFYCNALIQSLSPKTSVGFQMVWSVKGTNAQLVKGTLRQALERALELKAHFVEVYAEDCKDPAYAKDLQKVNARLQRLR
jgi:hypothetical protein